MTPVPSHRLKLFGAFELERADGRRLDLRAKKARALLVHLVLHPRGSATRGRLAALLWGDMGEERARANLRQSLFTLRRLLDDPEGRIIGGDDETVRIQREAFDVDVHRFDRLARDPAEWERAIEAYGGNLLPGFVLGEEAFDEWLDTERARVAGLASACFEKAVAARSVAPPRLEWLLTRWLSFEPSREEAHHALMELYAETGRRSKAIEQFEICRRELARAYDAAPSDATIALYRTLSDAEVEPSQPAWLGADVVHFARRLLGTDSPPLVRGRKEVLQELEPLVERRTGVLFLLGEAGVGKTTLALESLRMATSRGAVVLAGSTHDFGSGAPYSAFVDAWDDRVRTTGGDGANNPFLSPHRSRLFRSVEKALLALARDGWIYLLIEDVHLADDSSLHLLHYLARASLHLPLRIVVTCREEEVRPDSLLFGLIARLERASLVQRLQLRRLTQEATEEQIADLMGGVPERSLSESVYAMSEGNPFYTRELVRALREDRSLAVPDTLLAPIRQRVAELGSDAQRLLGAASIIGMRFDFQRASQVSELSTTAALDALERALAARLLEEDGEAYRFRHALTRQAIYEALTHARRVALHRKVAELPAPDGTQQIADVVALRPR